MSARYLEIAADKARAHCDAQSGGAKMLARTIGEDDGALFIPGCTTSTRSPVPIPSRVLTSWRMRCLRQCSTCHVRRFSG